MEENKKARVETRAILVDYEKELMAPFNPSGISA
jgi:hypothetical protein